MDTQYKVSLQNSGGELDCRIVSTEGEIRAAALELITEVADMYAGDKIIVTEIEAQ